MPGRLHVLLLGAGRTARLGRHLVELALQPFVLDLPDARPMLPGRFGQAVVERQRGVIEPEIGRALHVGVAAEDVGASAGRADIAGREASDAEGAHVRRADRVLGRAHAPDDGRRLLLRELFRDALQLLARNAGDALHLLGVPLLDLLADVVHAVDALGDEVLVLPAVLEDVPEHAPHERDVGAGAEPHILGRVRRGAREARIADDHVAAVYLLRSQEMLHRDRVRLGRVRADEDHGLGVADVVVGVGLRAVAPGVGDARDRGRVADAGLVVDRVRAPEGAELAHQVGSLVRELRRAEPEDGVRAVLAADVHQLVADLVDRLIPRNPLPLVVDELERVFEPAVAVDDLADRRALRAMRAAVDRALPARLLAGPDAVLNLCDDRAADRAVGADVLLDLGLRARHRSGNGGGPRLAHRSELDRSDRGKAADRETRPLEEAAPVDRLEREARRDGLQFAAARFAALALDQHGALTSSTSRSRSSDRTP